MAYRHHWRRRRHNPTDGLGGLFGPPELEEYALTGTGLLAAQVIDEHVVLPLAQKIMPQVVAHGTPSGKLADVIGTALSTWGTWFITDLIRPAWASPVALGGGVLTLFKVAGLIVPGLVLNVQVPSAISFSSPFASAAPAASSAPAVQAASHAALPSSSAAAAPSSPQRTTWGRLQAM